MTDDGLDQALRARLAALDPEAGRVVAPLTAHQKENAMSTTDSDRKAVLGMTAACLAVVGSGIAVALIFSGGEHKETTEAGGPSTEGKKTVLQLTQAPVNPAAGICVPTSADTLRGAVHAFEGKATSVEGGTTSFDVTHWYKGGDQQVVTLTTDGPDTVEDGASFEEGKTYLVAAGEDGVGPCSGTGEEDAALKALFDEAYG
jgi:hypothetical protein